MKHPDTISTVEDTSDPTLKQYTLYQLEDTTLPKAHENPYKVSLTTEGKSVLMDTDTGQVLPCHLFQTIYTNTFGQL